MSNNNSQKEILKSTGIVGGTQILIIIFGILRNKAIAVLIGPFGIGLIGMYQSIIDLTKQITGFGINFSGVKSIAESQALNDDEKIGTTAAVLKKWAIGTGLLGMLSVIVFCVPISIYTFGNSLKAPHIAVLSIVLLLVSISGSQLALLQGLREIKQMSKASVYGAFLGLICTVPLYYLLGADAIVPSIILSAVIVVLLSWLFTRKLNIKNSKITIKDAFKSGKSIAKLGFILNITTTVSMVILYITRSFLLKKMDMIAVGCFQACWTISNLYLGTVFNAMLMDYFPRLSAMSNDDKESSNLMNQQLELSLLIIVPMLIGIILFAPLIIKILYSPSFYLVVGILQWQIFGSFFLLISWTLGVVYLARGAGKYALIVELIGAVVYILTIFFGWDYWGFTTLGIAFAIDQIIRLGFVHFTVGNIIKFNLSPKNVKLILFYGVLVVATFICALNFDGLQLYISGVLLLSIVLLNSYLKLRKIILKKNVV